MTSTLRPVKRPARVKQLERFAQSTQGIASGEPRLPAKGFKYAVGAGERSGVAVRRARRRGRAPRFHHRDGLAGAARLVRGACESARDP